MIDVVLRNMVIEARDFAKEDEDWDYSSYAANMETAGFNEPKIRLCLGGVYNHIFMLSMLRSPDNREPATHEGKVRNSGCRSYCCFCLVV